MKPTSKNAPTRHSTKMQATHMDTSRKRARPADAITGPPDWPGKALPSLDPTLQPYAWPYGPGELIEERHTIGKILELAHSIRMPNLKWPGLASFYSNQGVGLLGMMLTAEEAFVDSDVKRNMLVDRVHHYFNIDWKMEVQAMTSNPNDGMAEQKRQSLRLVHYHLTEDHLYDTVNKIDRLRSLFDSLKPETIDLVRRCATHNDIKRSMLVTYRPAPFLQEAQWTA